MITAKETFDIDSIDDLFEHCWSGAIDRLNEIAALGIEPEFIDYLNCYFDDGEEHKMVEINDFIWFECDDWIEDQKLQLLEEEQEENEQGEENE